MAGAVMRGSGILWALVGITLLFFPLESARAAGFTQAPEALLQLVSGLYLGFATLNWFGRNAIYGGIYGRPIMLANLAHGMIGLISVVQVVSPPVPGAWKWTFAGAYAVYLAAFMALLFWKSGPKPAETA